MIRTRSFGYDRQPVPEIGMGCYRITADMGVDRPTALATLERAYERGVRLFDTAPLYGHGEADALLGEAFAHVPDDEIIIGAKLSGPTGNLWDYTYDNCMRGFEQTLRHVKRDSVHVLQIHGNPGWRDLAADHRREWHDVFGQGMAYEALLRIREQGGCKYIGVTSHWSPHLQRCLEHAEFDSVEIASHYNLLMNAARRTVLPVAERTNTAVVVATPLFAGRLVSLAALAAQGVRRSGDSAPAAAVLGEVTGRDGLHAAATGHCCTCWTIRGSRASFQGRRTSPSWRTIWRWQRCRGCPRTSSSGSAPSACPTHYLKDEGHDARAGIAVAVNS